MRAAVRSVSARSVSGLRAGSALTIGVGGNELSKAIALLRSVGGRMYLPELTSRVASDGSGGSPVAGDVIGWLPDRVSGANAAAQSTTGFKPKLIREPILGPELVVNGSGDNTAGWSATNCTVASVGGEFVVTPTVAAPYPSISQTFTTVVGKQYQVAGSARQGTSTQNAAIEIGNKVTKVNGTTTAKQLYGVFTATASSHEVKCTIFAASAVVGHTAIFDNISVREILGYTERYSLEFDGVDDVMTGACPVPNNSDFTMVVAMNQLAVKRNRGVLIYGATSSAEIGFDGGGTDSFSIKTDDAISYGSMYSSFTALGQMRVLTGMKSGANCIFRANGVQKAAVTLANPAQTFTGMKIGQAANSIYANADIAFVAIAPVALTVGQLQILERAAAQAAWITL